MVPFIYNKSYDEILSTYYDYYMREFGERKYLSVVEKLKKSNKIAALLEEANQKQAVPNAMDILNRINTIGFFIFSSGQTQVLASLMTLDVWNRQTNEEFEIAGECELKSIAIEIIKQSASTFQ